MTTRSISFSLPTAGSARESPFKPLSNYSNSNALPWRLNNPVVQCRLLLAEVAAALLLPLCVLETSLTCDCSALMRKKLEEGINLVVDRYAFSGVAFTSAKVRPSPTCPPPLSPPYVLLSSLSPPARARSSSSSVLPFVRATERAQGYSRDWCWAPEEGLLAPDLVVYMDMPVLLLLALPWCEAVVDRRCGQAWRVRCRTI